MLSSLLTYDRAVRVHLGAIKVLKTIRLCLYSWSGLQRLRFILQHSLDTVDRRGCFRSKQLFKSTEVGILQPYVA